MKPRIFIGSSVEGKNVADAIQFNLEHYYYTSVWSQTFGPGGTTIESLVQQSKNCDFGIFVLSADDMADIRGMNSPIARDNVIFEAGLFMGELGRDRVFLVHSRSVADFHLPTDFAGINTASYDPKMVTDLANARSALGTASTNIRIAIDASSWNSKMLNISANLASPNKTGLTYPYKLKFKFTNPLAEKVFVRIMKFSLNPLVRIQSGAPAKLTKPAFIIKDPSGNENFFREMIFDSGQSIGDCWVPIEEKNVDVLNDLMKRKEAGSLSIRCIWLGGDPQVYNYTFDF